MKRTISVPGIENLKCYTGNELDNVYGSGMKKSLSGLPMSQWVVLRSGALAGKNVFRAGTYVLIGDCRKSPRPAPESSVVAGQLVEETPNAASIEAGNYKKGHVVIDNLSLTIENPAGFWRQGIDKGGHQWRIKLHCDYGYIRGTVGYDKDHVDCFIKPNYRGGADTVYVVNQVNPRTKKFDEHKIMLGYNTPTEAKTAYLSNYEPGWQGVGTIVSIPVQSFRDWLQEGGPKKGKLTEYAINLEKGFRVLEKSLTAIEQILPRERVARSTKEQIVGLYSQIFDLLGAAANTALLKSHGKKLQEQHPGSYWRTIRDEDSPLKGRHVLIGTGATGKTEILYGGAKEHWHDPHETMEKKLGRGLKNVDSIIEKTGGLTASDRAKLGKHKRLMEEQLSEYNLRNMGDIEKHLAIGERIDDAREKAGQEGVKNAVDRAIAEALGRRGIDADSFSSQERSEIGKWCLEVVPVKLADVKVEPETFQFKTKVGKAGVTDKLRDVEVWDPKKAGTILLWQSTGGDMYVANGHHRMELAGRLGVPYLNATILQESDGYAKSDARRIAAETNIAEGNATLEDSVKYLRETGYDLAKMRKLGIPMTEGRARQAFHIAQLGDTGYKQFLTGKLTPKYAEAIGEFAATNETKQEVVLSMLSDKKFGGITGELFRQMLPGILSTMDRARELAGSAVTGTQGALSFFDDDEEFQNSLKLEKFQAQVASKVSDHIGKIRRVLAVPEKLSSGEVSEIAEEYGIRVKTDRDLVQIKAALHELEYRLEPERRHTDADVKRVMNSIMDRKIASGLPVDKWSLEDADISDMKRHFIDDYDKNRMRSGKLTM